MKTIALPLSISWCPVERRRETFQWAFSFGFALLTALAAQVKIPLGFTPIPLTLQTLVVLSSGLVLGSGFGAFSQALYLLLGLAGVPVFTGSVTGVSVFFGATAGYLFGFPLYAFIAGQVFYSRWFQRQSRVLQVLSLFVVSFLTVHLPGVSVLRQVLGITWTQAFYQGTWPFIIGDLVKQTVALSTVAWLMSSQKKK